MKQFSICLALNALIFLSPTVSLAEVNQQTSMSACGDLVKECLVQIDQDRVNCLFSASRHPFCEGSPLGDLVYRRWIFTANRPAGVEAPAALLGPGLIDAECIANFDSTFSAQLVADTISDAAIEALNDSLMKCRKDLSIELTRP